MVFQQQQEQSIRTICGTRTLGDVTLQLKLEDDERILPGSRIRVDVQITNTSLSQSFDEIQIRVKEVHSWSGVTSSKYSSNEQLTETTNLTKKNTVHWTERPDGMERRVIDLKKMSLDIPNTASHDQRKGLVRVYHFLQVKLISTSRCVQNLCFRFPIVLGGEQYQVVPKDHPVNLTDFGKMTLVDAVAGTVGYVADALDLLWSETPLGKKVEQKRPSLRKQARPSRQLSLLF